MNNLKPCRLSHRAGQMAMCVAAWLVERSRESSLKHLLTNDQPKEVDFLAVYSQGKDVVSDARLKLNCPILAYPEMCLERWDIDQIIPLFDRDNRVPEKSGTCEYGGIVVLRHRTGGPFESDQVSRVRVKITEYFASNNNRYKRDVEVSPTQPTDPDELLLGVDLNDNYEPVDED